MCALVTGVQTCALPIYGSLRDELLNGEILYSLTEAQILIEAWRRHYNTVRPHSALGYRPPAPEAVPSPVSPSCSASLPLRPPLPVQASRHYQITRTPPRGPITPLSTPDRSRPSS